MLILGYAALIGTVAFCVYGACVNQPEDRYESEYDLFAWWLGDCADRGRWRDGAPVFSLDGFNRFCTEVRVQLVILGQETSDLDERAILGEREI